MFSLRSSAVALAVFALALSGTHASNSAYAPPDPCDPVVGLAEGVMASFGVAKSPTPALQSQLAIDPQTGRAIYLPTGEVVEEVIPVRASRVNRALSATRAASAVSKPAAHACPPDGGVELPSRRDAGASAT